LIDMWQPMFPMLLAASVCIGIVWLMVKEEDKDDLNGFQNTTTQILTTKQSWRDSRSYQNFKRTHEMAIKLPDV